MKPDLADVAHRTGPHFVKAFGEILRQVAIADQERGETALGSFKAKAPEPLIPSRRFATPEAALQHFQESRNRTVALAASRGDLRDRAGAHPVFQELDAYQWMPFLSGHTMRHTAQINEVKADPGFQGR